MRSLMHKFFYFGMSLILAAGIQGCEDFNPLYIGSPPDPYEEYPKTTPSQLTGDWLYEVFPEYPNPLVGLCPASLQKQMWSELHIEGKISNISGAAQGGRGLLSGILNGSLSNNTLKFSGENTVDYGCQGGKVKTSFTGNASIDPNKIQGPVTLTLSPAPGRCQDAASYCYIDGSFQLIRK